MRSPSSARSERENGERPTQGSRAVRRPDLRGAVGISLTLELVFEPYSLEGDRDKTQLWMQLLDKFLLECAAIEIFDALRTEIEPGLQLINSI